MLNIEFSRLTAVSGFVSGCSVKASTALVPEIHNSEPSRAGKPAVYLVRGEDCTLSGRDALQY